MSELHTITDDRGNAMKLLNDGKTVKVTLSLSGSTRHLGTINLATRTIVMTRNRETHLFNKSNSYGFNYYLLKNAKLFDKISLSDNYDKWVIDRQYILDNGKILQFSQQGFELQTFIPLDSIEQFKKNKK